MSALMPKPHRDPRFLHFLTLQVCALAYTLGHRCDGRVDPAHGPVDGMRSKGPDCEAIPLCRSGHDEQHAIGWDRFEKKYHFSRLQVAAVWFMVYTRTKTTRRTRRELERINGQ